MTFVLSFPRYAITHLGCHLRNNNNNNNNNNLFTYIAPSNIDRMIKGLLQSKKTNIYNR